MIAAGHRANADHANANHSNANLSNDRAAIESVASIMRLLVASGAIAPGDAFRTMAASRDSLIDPEVRNLWELAADSMKVRILAH